MSAASPKTIIVWYRNDLRIHDHPALAAAAKDAECVVPVFIRNHGLLHGAHSSPNRNRFLQECLDDLAESLRGLGAELIIREGIPETVLRALASEYGAEAVYYTEDYSSYAIKRDGMVDKELDDNGIYTRRFEGRLIASGAMSLRTKTSAPYKVFTPFWRQWEQAGRRPIVSVPVRLCPSERVSDSQQSNGVLRGIDDTLLSPNALKGGETAARKRLEIFLGNDIAMYHTAQNDMAADSTSRLSAYLHFGCVSAREIETMLPDSEGARAWLRQLCWRDFYYYVLFHYPQNSVQEFQERYRGLSWQRDDAYLESWKQGMTGYPVVDAAMRQLLQEGWMHNRARLIVGSFLTKDLLQDWRHGEAYFMKLLLDGDEANNNGNWQWIASVGVDPAPLFRRLYNPVSQQTRYDPTGQYVRKYVPELRHVPDEHLAQPWKMSEDEQRRAGCRIGVDYPSPIVDHASARQRALEWYRQA